MIGYGLVSAEGTCTPCGDNTFSTGTTSCLIGPDNCATCDHVTGKCLQCSGGYGLSTTGTCSKCNDNTWSDGSTSCKTGPLNCLACDHSTGACTKCSSEFGVTSSGSCESCTSNTYSDGTTSCLSGPTGCATCNHATGVCSACLTGYGISSTKNTCNKCINNTWSTGTTGCKSGPSNCVTCDHSTGQCVKCLESYGLSTVAGTCVSCTGNLWSSGNTSCQVGPTNCLTCDHVTGKCKTCVTGYALNSIAATCPTCVAGYGMNSAKQCTSCTSDSTFSTGGVNKCTTCVSSKGCLACNSVTGVCTSCALGMVPVSNKQTTCKDTLWTGPTQQVELVLSSINVNITLLIEQLAMSLKVSPSLLQFGTVDETDKTVELVLPASAVNTLAQLIVKGQIKSIASAKNLTSGMSQQSTSSDQTMFGAQAGEATISPGGIAGIVIGCAVVLGLLVVVAVLFIVYLRMPGAIPPPPQPIRRDSSSNLELSEVITPRFFPYKEEEPSMGNEITTTAVI